MSTSVMPETETETEPEAVETTPVAVVDAEPTDESWSEDDDDDELVEPEANEDAASDADPATPTPAADPAPSASTPEPEPELQPLRFDTGIKGMEYAPRGVHYDPKANVMKFDDIAAAQRMYTLAGKGVIYEQNREKFEGIDQRLEQAVVEAQKEANDLLESLEIAAQTLEPEALLNKIYTMVAGMPALRLQRANAEIERLRAGVNTPSGEKFPDIPFPQITEFAQRNAHQALDRIAKSGDYPWMTPQATDALRKIATDPKMTARFTYKATAEDVRENPKLRLNEPFFHEGDFREALAPYAQAWIDAHNTVSTVKTEAAKQVQTLATPAKTNAAILAHANKQPSATARKQPPAPKADETDEEREARARNELGQFIEQARRASQVRRR